MNGYVYLLTCLSIIHRLIGNLDPDRGVFLYYLVNGLFVLSVMVAVVSVAVTVISVSTGQIAESMCLHLGKNVLGRA